MVIKGYDVGVLLRKTLSEVWDDGVLGLSAQAAYSFFFSLFPLLLFLAPLFSLIGNEREVVNSILSRLSMTIPGEAYILLSSVVKDVVFGENAPGLVSIGILLAAFSGSAVIDTVGNALNQAYDITDPRSFWKKRLIAMGFAAVAAIIVVFSTIVMVAGHSVVDFIVRFLPFSGATANAWTIVQYPLALSLMTGFIWLLFYFLPHVKQKKSHVLVGSIFTLVFWLFITWLFRLYVVNFSSYNRTYGTIGGVIVLLTWMYWSMVALLVGGELNSELRVGTGRTDVPDTRVPSDALRDAAIAQRSSF